MADTDAIRELIIEACESAEPRITAYRLSQLSGGRVSISHCQRLLDRQAGLTTTRLQYLLPPLGLWPRSWGAAPKIDG